MDKYIEKWKSSSIELDQCVPAIAKEDCILEISELATSEVNASLDAPDGQFRNRGNRHKNFFNWFNTRHHASALHDKERRKYYMSQFKSFKKLQLPELEKFSFKLPAIQSSGLECHPLYTNDLLIGTPKSISIMNMELLIQESYSLSREMVMSKIEAVRSDAECDHLKLRWNHILPTNHSISCAKWIPHHRGHILTADVVHNNLYLYDVNSSDNRPIQSFNPTDLNSKSVRHLAFFPDERFVDVGWDGQIRFWDFRQLPHRPYRILRGQHQHHSIHSVYVTKNGCGMITACRRGIIQIWDTRYMASVVDEIKIDSLLPRYHPASLAYRHILMNPEDENQMAFLSDDFTGTLNLSSKQIVHFIQQNNTIDEFKGPEVAATSSNPRPMLGLKEINMNSSMRPEINANKLALPCWLPSSMFAYQRSTVSTDIGITDFSVDKPFIYSRKETPPAFLIENQHASLALAYHGGTDSLIIQSSNSYIPQVAMFCVDKNDMLVDS